MSISGEMLSVIFTRLIFYIMVIVEIITYIRAPVHTRRALIGIIAIVLITVLYFISDVFFRFSPVIGAVINESPIGIVWPIFYLTNKKVRSRITTILASIWLVVTLISYPLIMFGH